MDSLTVALPKGRNLKPSIKLFQAIGLDFSEALSDSRKLKFKALGEEATALIIRDSDIPTYVENQAADIGISGSDVLMEQGKELYEPLDLRFGKCHMMVAEPSELSERDNPNEWTHIRIATKFPNITETHFAGRGVQIEIIKLYGSIELAPIAGLAQRIVDIVSTGETLRQNGLVEVEKIMDISARLVVNRASLITRQKLVGGIIEKIAEAVPRLNLD